MSMNTFTRLFDAIWPAREGTMKPPRILYSSARLVIDFDLHGWALGFGYWRRYQLSVLVGPVSFYWHGKDNRR